jgi:hypothetical protein
LGLSNHFGNIHTGLAAFVIKKNESSRFAFLFSTARVAGRSPKGSKGGKPKTPLASQRAEKQSISIKGN